jgi:hypothetical protein
MPHRDRTEEFFTTVESMQARRQVGGGGGVMVSSMATSFPIRHATQPSTEFSIAAHRIGKDMHETTGQLGRLSKCK